MLVVCFLCDLEFGAISLSGNNGCWSCRYKLCTCEPKLMLNIFHSVMAIYVA